MGRMPKELKQLKRLCYICNKPIILFCGQSCVVTGGCCIGANWKGTKWLFGRSAHIHCYFNLKKKPKMMLDEKEVIKKIKKV